MNTISLKQPWAYLMFAGIKKHRKPMWKLPEKMKRERILIHASGKSLSWTEFMDYVVRLDCEDLEFQKKIEKRLSARVGKSPCLPGLLSVALYI